MKVSIVTATYNRGSTILRAVKSIKAQSYSNIQLVVIDGASKDQTTELIEPYLDCGDILISEEDEGIYDALNKGIKLAVGDIVGFLHSDDLIYDSDVISKVVEVFSDDSVDVVYGDACFFF